MNIRKHFKVLLAQREMTQGDLAKELGYCTRQVNRGINGGRVSGRLVKALAEWAGLTEDEVRGMSRDN